MEEKVVKENQTLMNIVISHALPLIVNGLIGQHLAVLKLVTQEFKAEPDTKKLKHNMEERNVLEIPLKLNFATMDLVQQLKHQLHQQPLQPL